MTVKEALFDTVVIEGAVYPLTRFVFVLIEVNPNELTNVRNAVVAEEKVDGVQELVRSM